MITADTITDEQLRELFVSIPEDIVRKQRGHLLRIIHVALGERRLRGYTRETARARCAEILNARGAK